MNANLYLKERETLLNDIHKDNQNLFNLSNKQKLIWILTNENISILHKVCNFLVTTFETRSKKLLKSREIHLLTEIFSLSLLIASYVSVHVQYFHCINVLFPII